MSNMPKSTFHFHLKWAITGPCFVFIDPTLTKLDSQSCIPQTDSNNYYFSYYKSKNNTKRKRKKGGKRTHITATHLLILTMTSVTAQFNTGDKRRPQEKLPIRVSILQGQIH